MDGIVILLLMYIVVDKISRHRKKSSLPYVMFGQPLTKEEREEVKEVCYGNRSKETN